VHSVRAVWHRRRWFTRVITACREETSGRAVRVLDIACGGSRYIRDAMSAPGARDQLTVTFLDQDPAALAFVSSWLPDIAQTSSRLVCGPVRRLPELLPAHGPDAPDQFDLVISTGLFDYLPDAQARELLAHVARLTRPGGAVAVCNFAPEDASRVVKDWVSDWRLIYRRATDVRNLFAHPVGVTTELSPDGGLVYALARNPS
jgi:extracellular factor (EF) 3-hydroxypalmitic acid methyl ester biosynthesis protein